MKPGPKQIRQILLCVFVLSFALMTRAQSVEGLWDATITRNGVSIPFELQITGKDGELTSYFFNGDDKVNPSTSGSFQDSVLALEFASYATKLMATLQDGTLTGSFDPAGGDSYAFQARRHSASVATMAGAKAPDIDGVWEVQVKSPKGEAAWHFIVHQNGAKVAGAILRVDGDTGMLSGEYQNGKFSLSHFTGERPLRVDVTPAPDGSLELEVIGFRSRQTLTALRPEAARAKGLKPPDDPTQHTRLKNPDEPLRFSFPDLNGQMVSSTDPRFQGKVVLVNIMGSWCPNCHDEAPFLQELYRKYHGQGLEIIALDFEQQDQLKDLPRLKAFIKRYGIEYTCLVAGEPDQLSEKLPQADNLNAWPTTFFVGRDGLVHSIHTGFTSQASGGFDSHLKDEVTSQVVALLSRNVRTVNGGTE